MRWGLEGVTVRFGSQVALEDVTLSVTPGSVNVVVGGDGAGKSTLLRALVGLVRLAKGRSLRPAKKDIGYVPATAGLYVDLTVEENLAFVGRAYGVTGVKLTTRTEELLDRIGLMAARTRLGGQLSGGMQRKLAVAMALLHRPPMMVLDEPTTGIDPVSRSELWRLISGAAADGTGVVVATTYVNEANRGSTVMLLEQGRAITTGSPADIIAGVPGTLGTVRSTAKPQGHSWRWGTSWRVWTPSDALPEGAQQIQPSFDDAVMIAELVNERGA
jgi:ABC-2 type transport system ATP-binding protein